MFRRHPARFFRATALGVVAAGLLVPAAASAQVPVLSNGPVFQPTFVPGPSEDTGQGPILSLFHGRFDATPRETVAAVSDTGPAAGGGTAGAAVTLFGETSDGFGRRDFETLTAEMPVAAVAARLNNGDRESTVVVGRGAGEGVLETVDWHRDGIVTHRQVPLPGIPTGVAVGRFLPGQGVLIAVNLNSGKVRFYAATPNDLEHVATVDGIASGPITASGTSPESGFDTLITRASSDGVSGTRVAFRASDDAIPVYSASSIGGTTVPFGASAGRVAQDRDNAGRTWFTSLSEGRYGVNWLRGGDSTGLMDAGGPFLASSRRQEAPVVLDMWGHGERDAVAIPTGSWLNGQSTTTGETVSGELVSGRIATAIDVDRDHRDELAVADGSTVTLFFNHTGSVETTPTLEARSLVPSVYSSITREQTVTSRTFDLAGPRDTDDRYECAIGDGDWIPCANGERTALKVDADGHYTVRVRRMAAGTKFWSAEQAIDFRVEARATPAPLFLQEPAAVTNAVKYRVRPPAGSRVEYRIDDDSTWRLATVYPDGDAYVGLTNQLVDGHHVVRFRTVDQSSGATSEPAESRFLLDRAGPEAPTKISGPASETTARKASFAFDGEEGATFECRIDQRQLLGVGASESDSWAPCLSPWDVDDLELGEHVVEVRQIDAAGNPGAPAAWIWTVVAPTPDVIQHPNPTGPTKETVTTPAAETPAAPAAKPSAPAEPAPTKPQPAKPADAKPVAAKLSVGVPAGKGQTPTATSTGRRVAVGCAAPGAEGYRCAVTVSRNGKTVGAGRRTGAGVVPVNLDKATARKVQRLGGLKVRVTLTVKTSDGETRKTQKTVRILPKKVLVVPTDGLFAFDSAKPSKGADALAKQIAGQLDGARTITIVGHTDAKGTAAVNERLGRQRAEAFRRLLAKHGFGGKVAVESAGDTQPRASNATDGGRELNRRVEIEVRY